jgi:hypothetical protein
LKREQKLTAQGERNHALDGERKAAEHAASATRHTEQSACDQRTHKIYKIVTRPSDYFVMATLREKRYSIT